MTITSALFCYDLTTTFLYTPGLHISLCGHNRSRSPRPLTIGSITLLTNLHRQHISHSPILTSHHTEQLGSTMVCYLQSSQSEDNVHYRLHSHGDPQLLRTYCFSTMFGSCLTINWNSYYFIRAHYMISLCYPWDFIYLHGEIELYCEHAVMTTQAEWH